MAGEVDYMLRVVVPTCRAMTCSTRSLIGAVPLKKRNLRFAMEKIKSVTALPVRQSRCEIPLDGISAFFRRTTNVIFKGS